MKRTVEIHKTAPKINLNKPQIGHVKPYLVLNIFKNAIVINFLWLIIKEKELKDRALIQFRPQL